MSGYNATIVTKARELADNLFDPSGSTTVTANEVPAAWVNHTGITAADIATKLMACIGKMSTTQKTDQEILTMVFVVTAENTMLKTAAKPESTIKTASYLVDACLDSLAGAYNTYKSSLSTLDGKIGSAESTSLFKLHNVETERVENRTNKKKPRREVCVISSKTKVNLIDIDGGSDIDQGELDVFLLKSEQENTQFPWMEFTKHPCLPVNRSWTGVDLSKALQKTKQLTMQENGKYTFEDLADFNKEEESLPFGRYIAVLQRWLTMCVLSGRIGVADAYGYISIILDIGAANTGKLAQQYDSEVRRKASRDARFTPDLATIANRNNFEERCKLFRKKDTNIIGKLVNQLQLQAAKLITDSKSSNKNQNPTGKGTKNPPPTGGKGSKDKSPGLKRLKPEKYDGFVEKKDNQIGFYVGGNWVKNDSKEAADAIAKMDKSEQEALASRLKKFT